MKERIVKALTWGVSVMIGISIVKLIQGQPFNIVHVLLGGVVMGIIDFVFETVSKRNRKK